MAQLDEKQLKMKIKSGDFSSVYLIYGNEGYLKQNYSNLIVSKNIDDSMESFNYIKYDGKGLELQKAFDEANLMPMMSEKKCIVIDNFKLEGMGEKDLKILGEYLMNPCESTILIFLQSNPDFSPTSAKKAVELFKKYADVAVLNKRTGNDLIKPLISSAGKQNCDLSPSMANYLVSVVGDDFNVLVNELNKVCSYTKSGEITKEKIDAVAVKTVDAKVYSLTKYLISKNFDKAFETLNSLFVQKLEPEYILGSIISTYVDMYRAKVSLSCCGKADILKDDFRYGNRAFCLTNAARDSSKMDLSAIRKCLGELANADFKLKNSRDSASLIIEQLMVKLFLIANGERV